MRSSTAENKNNNWIPNNNVIRDWKNILRGNIHQKGNWVWPKGYIYPFSGDEVGGGEAKRFLTDSAQQLFYTSNHLRHPQFSNCQGHIILSKSPSQQKFAWRTDILRNRSIGCPWSETNTVKAKETSEILTRRYREKTKQQNELKKLHVHRTEGNEELTQNIKTEAR